MSTWLHIGSSPTVLDMLPRALEEWEFDSVITCNAGIKLYPVPDYYVAIDGHASVEYEQRARDAQAQGCKLITLWRHDERARHERRVNHYDEQLELPDRGWDFDGYNFTAFRFSGPFCLQYAVIHGATTLVIVGCDGWTGDRDYFDHDDGHIIRNDHGDIFERSTMGHLVPAFRDIAKSRPDVRIVQYGEPLYEVDYPNWEVRK